MNLITKKRVLDYIKRVPEGQTSLLTWFVGFNVKEGERILHAHNHEGSASGASTIGCGDYEVRFMCNFWLDSAYIEFIGTPEESRASIHEKTAKLWAANSGGTIEEERAPRNIVKVQSILVSDEEGNLSQTEAEKEKHLSFKKKSRRKAARILKTEADYEAALRGAIEIFHVGPDTAEFDELASLIPSLEVYEDLHFKLPELNPRDVIALEMKKRKEIPLYLAPIIGTEEDVELFLQGKKDLSDEVLRELYSHYKIDFLYP
jgi:HTH-type transcriptional regulator/antitoxin HigA